jgi:AcrR family transcriptional regulator
MKQTRIKGPARRERFLDAAAEIVLEQGVAAVTMEGIALRTGVNKSLGYRYFKDREDLLVSLFDRETEHYRRQIEQAVPADADFETWVRSALKHWFRRTDERGELFLRLTSDNGPLAARALARRNVIVGEWADALQRLYGLPPRRAQHFAWLMVSCVPAGLAVRDGTDDAEIIDTLAIAVLAGAAALQARFAPDTIPSPGPTPN